ncbi:hypothetical protein BDV98DRAFT_659903 [Pterulicium gracile]|uniref:F-box domain-containing protein n=1 Tax=Pterulicium gracile TaxID=1884261 RepID=A0A5C3Q1Z5_9AGAR|nr:hypothetical protein BDV98DRAFT_659903 [Pterula gracilis]
MRFSPRSSNIASIPSSIAGIATQTVATQAYGVRYSQRRRPEDKATNRQGRKDFMHLTGMIHQLSAARRVPLYISVEHHAAAAEAQVAVKFLSNYHRQWRQISFTVGARSVESMFALRDTWFFDELEVLKLYVDAAGDSEIACFPTTTFSHTPKLRSLILHTIAIDTPHFPWTQIVSLRLSNVVVERRKLQEILLQCVATLKTLVLELLVFEDTSGARQHSFQPASILLPHLKRLNVGSFQDSKPEATGLLEALRLPALTYLDMYGSDTTIMEVRTFI